MPDEAPNPADTDQAALLRTFLAHRDTPCPCCNYNLRGLQTSRCPECNQNLHLAVNLTEPRLGGYLAALCGLLSGIGMAAVVLSIILYLLTFKSGRASVEQLRIFVGIPVGSLIVLTTLLLIALRRTNRVWFRTAPPARRYLAVLACWAATALCIAWYLWAAL